MKYDVKQCRIVEKKEIAKEIFSVIVEESFFAQQAVPGQFAQIYVPGKTLRRPISICDVDKERGTLRFVFAIRGEGTAILARQESGDTLDILAPLGQGFRLGDTGRKVLFIGGGIGVPPLLYAARPFGENATVVLGFRDAATAILEEDFRRAGCRVIVFTEDGSAGRAGRVTGCFDELEGDAVFACGPHPMLQAVHRFAQQRGIPAQVSLEERMACGIGACLGCACRVYKEDGEQETYAHVCKNGPVFDSRNIVWQG